MKTNMGNVDRVARLIVAVVISVLYYKGVLSGAVAVILLIIAAVFAVTSFVGMCPLYSLFRLSTKKG